MKDTEIYNIFNTEKILNRPSEVAISNTSGLAGVAYWINKHFYLDGDKKLTKHDDMVIRVKAEIDKSYADGRTTLMGDDELVGIITEVSPEFIKKYGDKR
jgi:isopropylmalate/homocitrate/citramalate synthase